jgi:hypothetical protein
VPRRWRCRLIATATATGDVWPGWSCRPKKAHFVNNGYHFLMHY